MRRRLSILLLLLAVACDGKSAASQQPAPFADGAAMFPSETRALIGFRVAAIGKSPLAGRMIDWMMETDPTQQQALIGLLRTCAVDPAKDVDTVAIGIGAGPSEIAVLAKGRFDETALLACLRDSMTKKGGKLEAKKLGGRMAYNAVDAASGTSVWIAFGAGSGVVVATSESWLTQVLDPSVPKAAGRADTSALVGRVGGDAAIWGVVYLTPETSQRIADATKGAVKQGPGSLTGELALDDTAALTVKLDLPTPEDAVALIDFARSQHIWIALAAQKLGIGRIVNKLAFAADGKVVSIGLRLDQAEVTQLVEALDKLAEK
jgi:hypothetical protein